MAAYVRLREEGMWYDKRVMSGLASFRAASLFPLREQWEKEEVIFTQGSLVYFTDGSKMDSYQSSV